MAAVPGGLTVRFEDSILFLGQEEPDASASIFDAVVQRLPSFKVHAVAAAIGKLEDFLRMREGQLLGERRFEIGLQELAVPALPQHEIHIHAVQRAILRLTALAIFLTGGVWRGQGRLAAAAYFA